MLHLASDLSSTWHPCDCVWRSPTVVYSSSVYWSSSFSYLQPHWAGVAQVSFLWVGFQPVILLECSRQIQRESVPKWTWPLKLIINSDPSCIVARYPIVSCRRPRVCEFTEKVGLRTLQSSGYLRILKQVLKGWSQRETGISGSRNGVVHLSFLDQRVCIPTKVVSKKLNLSHYLKRVGKVASIPSSHKEMILACAFLCLLQKFRSFLC